MLLRSQHVNANLLTDLPIPRLAGLTAEPALPLVLSLGAKPVPPSTQRPSHGRVLSKPPPPVVMDYPETEADPWGATDVDALAAEAPSKPNGIASHEPLSSEHQSGTTPQSDRPTHHDSSATLPRSPPSPRRTGSSYTVPSQPRTASSSSRALPSDPAAGWSYFDGRQPSGGFADASPQPQYPPLASSPFGGPQHDRPGLASPGLHVPRSQHQSSYSATNHGRPVASGDEQVLVSLMPEKEGFFLFQHHNYEVTSPRRNSKVVRRYSDFAWLLDCLHKRYPFRVLPLLPPKRVAGESWV